MHNKIKLTQIEGRGFGGMIDARGSQQQFFDQAFATPSLLPDMFDQSGGLLLVKGLERIAVEPECLVRMSHLFGSEVENYLNTPTPRNMIHEDVSEVLIISNLPPCDRQPPPRPSPVTTDSGRLPVQFPHRLNWHTDQSFRRPPPDLSLFYGVITTPHGQGQTLFADGYAAYEELPDQLKQQIEGLSGLHALLGTGRTEKSILDGIEPMKLLPHQTSQQQPLVRIHPVTGKPALYLCERTQMDWLDGPIVGMQPGPGGEGAKLLYQLMSHYTDAKYVYAHEWDDGDLVVYDNRCLVHCATWFDAKKHDRLMWRTTVMGNPGAEYEGEARSWIPQQGQDLLEGLGDGRWENLTHKNVN
ncbi:MAG: taurine dioxygenase [Parasphingorhabdus sp.]|jgi:taurine dioxygenase